jgi:hypothetical protein
MSKAKTPGVIARDAGIVEADVEERRVEVRPQDDAIVSQASQHKPAANEPVAVDHQAGVEQAGHPEGRGHPRNIIVRPEMIEWHKDKHVRRQTKVHIASDLAIPEDSHTRQIWALPSALGVWRICFSEFHRITTSLAWCFNQLRKTMAPDVESI